MYFCFRTFFFCHIAYQFRFFVIFSWWSYFSPKLFRFSCIRLLVWFRVMFPYLLVEFSFVVLECPILSVVLPFVDIFLIFLLRQYFLVYFLKLYYYFSLCCLFLSLHVPASFLCLIILAFFRRFFLSAFESNFLS